jgi:phage-related minor tail protein
MAGDKLAELYAELSADTSKWTKGFRSAQKDLGDTGKTAQGLDTQLMGMVSRWAGAFSVTAIGAFALRSALDFEKAEFSIRRATGAIGENLASLKGSFETVYQTSGKSAEEIAKALSKITVETGATGTELENLTSYNLKFAKVMNLDVQQAIQGTQAAFKRWDVDVRDQATGLDLLFRVTQATGIGFEKLSGGMVEAAPIMRTLGFSFEQTAALIGMMEEKEINAGQAISAMSRLLTKFAKDTGDPVLALKALNERIMGAKDSAEALHMVMGSGGTRGGAALVAYVDAVRRGGFELGGFEKRLKSMTDSVGKAAAETDSFTDKWNKLIHNLQTLTVPAGKTMIDFFSAIVEGIKIDIEWINKLNESLRGMEIGRAHV